MRGQLWEGQREWGRRTRRENNGRWTHWHPCSSQSSPSSRGSPTPCVHTHTPPQSQPQAPIIYQGKERLPSRTFPATSPAPYWSVHAPAVTGMAWWDFLPFCMEPVIVTAPPGWSICYLTGVPVSAQTDSTRRNRRCSYTLQGLEGEKQAHTVAGLWPGHVSGCPTLAGQEVPGLM